MSSPPITRLISKAFSKETLLELSRNSGESQLLRQLKDQLEILTPIESLWDFYNSLFQLLRRGHRTEYFYKNLIALRLAKGRHKLSNIGYFTEFQAGDSITDVVLANGTTTAYEIKTEYDSFRRLDKQLADYQTTFEFVNVVVHQSQVAQALKVCPTNVGLITVSRGKSLSEIRPAASNIKSLSANKVFACLLSREYKEFGRLHIQNFFKLTPLDQFYKSKQKFQELSKDEINQYFTEILKRRFRQQQKQVVASTLPDALLSVALSAKLGARERSKIGRLFVDQEQEAIDVCSFPMGQLG